MNNKRAIRKVRTADEKEINYIIIIYILLLCVCVCVCVPAETCTLQCDVFAQSFLTYTPAR